MFRLHPEGDWFFTVVGAIILTKFINVSPIAIFVILIVISIILHYIFDVPTNTNYYLGISSKSLSSKQ